MERATRFTICMISATGLLAAPGAFAATHYVDNCVTMGSDSNNGTSTSTPWLTLAHASAHTYSAGDSLLLRRTCIWREFLTISQSGSSGSPILVGAYGTGAQPIMDGSDLLSSGWTHYSGNVWQHALAPANAEHLWVFFNGVAGGPNGGNPMASIAAIVAPNEWFFDSSAHTLYVYSTSDPATAFTSPGVEATTRRGVVAGLQSYVTFDNLNVRRSTNNCFDMYQVMYGTVSNTTTSYCGKNNIVFYNSTRGTSDYYTVANNVVSHCAEDCIAGKWSSNGLIYGNDVSHAGIQLDDESGISIYSSDSTPSYNNRIYNNYSHDHTEQTGPVGTRCYIIDTIGNGGTNYVYNNLGYNCNGSGIVIIFSANQQVFNNVLYGMPSGGNLYVNGIKDEGSNGTLIYGNTLYNNQWAQIDLDNNDVNPVVKNNILIATGSQHGLLVASSSGQVTDYNLVYGVANLYNVAYSSNYSSAAAYYAATGNGQHDVNADPKFTNASGGEFTLQSGSPAIDAGIDLGATYQLGLAPTSSWPLSVSTTNQNSYGTSWEIGAFVFASGGAQPAAPTELAASVH